MQNKKDFFTFIWVGSKKSCLLCFLKLTSNAKVKNCGAIPPLCPVFMVQCITSQAQGYLYFYLYPNSKFKDSSVSRNLLWTFYMMKKLKEIKNGNKYSDTNANYIHY
jgi:hypothetical protein